MHRCVRAALLAYKRQHAGYGRFAVAAGYAYNGRIPFRKLAQGNAPFKLRYAAPFSLDAPNIATIFIGIFVGILFGSIPFSIPGMPVPLKLGIAGGPLIIAILIGRFGYRFKLVTYTTTSANMMLREMGLALFLASVGIKAGAGFWETVVQGDGLKYVYTGFLITIIPILIIGTIARLKFKFNYFTIMGMLAGTYTDPPALAYANSICSKEAPAVGYSTVYPLSMFLRIFAAQIVVLFFCGA